MNKNKDILKGFGGDKYFKEEFKKLAKKFNIKTIIETGTYKGDTTKEFAKIVDKVYTIEATKKYYNIASRNLKDVKNVKIIQGNSPKILKKILPNVKKPVMFFLDAHWWKYWPIHDELKAISKFKDYKNSVIVIHDFYVPKKNFNYDTYIEYKNPLNYWIKTIINYLSRMFIKKNLFKRQKLDYDYIREHLFEINPNYKYYYNKNAEGVRVGIIYIHP